MAVLQTVKLVDGCQWSDNLVELQMWSRLSILAFNAENHSLVLHCGQRAVAFAESDKCQAKRQPAFMAPPNKTIAHILKMQNAGIIDHRRPCNQCLSSSKLHFIKTK